MQTDAMRRQRAATARDPQRTGGADHSISDVHVRACVRACLFVWVGKPQPSNERTAAEGRRSPILSGAPPHADGLVSSRAQRGSARAPADARSCGGRRAALLQRPSPSAGSRCGRAAFACAQAVGVYAGRGEPGGRWEDLDVPCQSVPQTHPHPQRPPPPQHGSAAAFPTAPVAAASAAGRVPTRSRAAAATRPAGEDPNQSRGEEACAPPHPAGMATDMGASAGST
jgi:hypothetical protein